MIREMQPEDWSRVREIYEQGIEDGNSTFTTECPSFEEWDANHLRSGRLVAETEGKIVGWLALSPVSNREPYKGVAEVSLYVDRNFHRRGIGTELLKTVCTKAPEYGIWSLLSVIFEINKPSTELHKKCGFREIGYRERIAKDRFGNWQNTIMLEKRL